MFEEYLNWSFAGNTGTDYATALGIFIGTTVFFWLFKKIILVSLQKLAKKTSFQYDDMLVEFLQEIRTPVYLLISLYVSTRFIEISDFLNKAIEYAAVLGLTYYVVKGINRVITHFKEVLIAKREKTESKTDHSLLEAMESVAKATVWIIALLLVLSNLGFDITALIAGLGIGGLAIAIAAQTILADAFAAVSIYFDKPFKVGDFIIIGDDMGTVKAIGLKTTRIQTLQGQELIMSNQELTSSRINNYKKMEKRRIAFDIGVTYNTPVKKLKLIPGIAKKAITSTKNCSFDRTHFNKFGDFSMNFEVVYYVNTSDYNEYMDAQQEINLKITEEFEKQKIEFAYPTQTVYVKK